jgi:hypothetical protein
MLRHLLYSFVFPPQLVLAKTVAARVNELFVGPGRVFVKTPRRFVVGSLGTFHAPSFASNTYLEAWRPLRRISTENDRVVLRT